MIQCIILFQLSPLTSSAFSPPLLFAHRVYMLLASNSLLLHLLRKYGEVVKFVRSSHYAFVTYDIIDSANKALENLNGYVVHRGKKYHHRRGSPRRQSLVVMKQHGVKKLFLGDIPTFMDRERLNKALLGKFEVK